MGCCSSSDAVITKSTDPQQQNDNIGLVGHEAVIISNTKNDIKTSSTTTTPLFLKDLEANEEKARLAIDGAELTEFQNLQEQFNTLLPVSTNANEQAQKDVEELPDPNIIGSKNDNNKNEETNPASPITKVNKHENVDEDNDVNQNSKPREITLPTANNNNDNSDNTTELLSTGAGGVQDPVLLAKAVDERVRKMEEAAEMLHKKEDEKIKQKHDEFVRLEQMKEENRKAELEAKRATVEEATSQLHRGVEAFTAVFNSMEEEIGNETATTNTNNNNDDDEETSQKKQERRELMQKTKRQLEEFEQLMQQASLNSSTSSLANVADAEKATDLARQVSVLLQELASSPKSEDAMPLSDEDKQQKLIQISHLIEQSKHAIAVASEERKIRENAEEIERKKKLDAILMEGALLEEKKKKSFEKINRVKEARAMLAKGLETLEALSQGEDMNLYLACKDECEDLAEMLDRLAKSDGGVDDSDKASTLIQKVGSLLQQLATADFAESERMEKQRKISAISQLVAASRSCIHVAGEERTAAEAQMMNQRAREPEAGQGVKEFTDVASLPEAPQSSNPTPSNTGRQNTGSSRRKVPTAVINNFGNGPSHGQPGVRMLENLLYSPPDSDEDDEETQQKKKEYFEKRKTEEDEAKRKANKPKPKAKAVSNRLYDPNKTKKLLVQENLVVESAAEKRKKYAASLPPPSPSPKRKSISQPLANKSWNSHVSAASSGKSFLRKGFNVFSPTASTNGSPTKNNNTNNNNSSPIPSRSSKHDKNLIANIFGNNNNNNKNKSRSSSKVGVGENSVNSKSNNNNSRKNNHSVKSVTMNSFMGRSNNNNNNIAAPPFAFDKSNKQELLKPKPKRATSAKTVQLRRREYSEIVRQKHQTQRETFGSVVGHSKKPQRNEATTSHQRSSAAGFSSIYYSASNFGRGSAASTNRRAQSHQVMNNNNRGKSVMNYHQLYSNNNQGDADDDAADDDQIYPTMQSHNNKNNGNNNVEEIVMQLMHSVRLVKSRGFNDMPLDARSHVLRMVRDTLMQCRMKLVGKKSAASVEKTLKFLNDVDRTLSVAEKNVMKAFSFGRTAIGNKNKADDYRTSSRYAFGSPLSSPGAGQGFSSPSPSSPTRQKFGSAATRNHSATSKEHHQQQQQQQQQQQRNPLLLVSPSNTTGRNSACGSATDGGGPQNISSILADTTTLLSDLRDRGSPIRVLVSAFKLILSPEFVLKSLPYERDQMMRLFKAQFDAARKYIRRGGNAEGGVRQKQLNELLSKMWNAVFYVHFPKHQNNNNNNNNNRRNAVNKISVRDQEQFWRNQYSRNENENNNNSNSPELSKRNSPDDKSFDHLVENADDSPLNNINMNSNLNNDLGSQVLTDDYLSTRGGNNNDKNNGSRSPNPRHSIFSSSAASSSSPRENAKIRNNNDQNNCGKRRSPIETRKRREHRLRAIQSANDSLIHSRQMLCAASFSALSPEAQESAFDLVQEQVNRTKKELRKANGQPPEGLWDYCTEPLMNQLEMVLSAMKAKWCERTVGHERIARGEISAFLTNRRHPHREAEDEELLPHSIPAEADDEKISGINTKDNSNVGDENGEMKKDQPDDDDPRTEKQQQRQPSTSKPLLNKISVNEKNPSTPQKQNTAQISNNSPPSSRTPPPPPITAWRGDGQSKLTGFTGSHWMFAGLKNNAKKATKK